MLATLRFPSLPAASVTGLALAALLASAHPADAQAYSFHEITNTELGTPTLSPDSSYLDAYGITNAGVVVGTVSVAPATPSILPSEGYEYDTKSGAVTLTNYQASSGGPDFVGVSGDGSKILGNYYPNAPAVYFTDSNGSITDLPAPYGLAAHGGGARAYYEGINNSGATVGQYFDGPGGTRHNAFLRNPDGTFISLADPDAIAYTPNFESGTLAFGINASGTIVGSYTYGELSQPDGSLFNLDNGFIRSADGTYTTFALPGEAATRIQGISDNGNLFGQYINDQSGLDFGNFADINGKLITDINAPGSVDGSTTLTGINDSGQISGYFQDADGVYHGFYADPVPEASSVISFGLLLSLGGLMIARKKSRRVAGAMP